jgi:secondary thiamine-phosphate synthase enzyme
MKEKMALEKIEINTSSRDQVIDITRLVQEKVEQSSISSGIAVIYSPHTTAAISVNENADPSVKTDMLNYLQKIIPQDSSFDHLEGNSDAHIKGGLMNFSQIFIIENSKVQLGTWQGIYFMEFDGPRNRNVWIKFIPDQSK